MSQIELRSVSLAYPSPLVDRIQTMPSITKRRMPEDSAKNGTLALDNVNLTIPDGQTFAVVGPSGCGKSTLLRVTSGLSTNYNGQVLYDQEPMENVSPGDRFIGMVFQNYALYPHFKGQGNLSFFFKVHKIDDAVTQERIEYTAKMMGLGFDDLLPREPGTLSGGQKQRLAIARAIVRSPRLFLFDEPLSNLDAQLRSQTRIEIKRLLHHFGITTLYVTHDQTEAIALGDQIVVMRSGKIEQVGPYQQLMDAPVNLFVASFLGLSPMTFLPAGRVSNGELMVDTLRIPIPQRILGLVSDGQTLIVGLRPEAATPATGENDLTDGVITLQGQINLIEPDYPHHRQLLQLSNGRLEYPCYAPIETTYKIGDLITVCIQLEQLHFFSQESGLRL